MEIVILLKLALMFCCILMGAFFSGIETALLSVSGLGLTGIKEKHPKTSKCLLVWETNPDNLMATILVGNNLVNIGAGVVSVSLSLDFALKFGQSHWLVYSTPMFVLVMILMFSEIVPKIFSRFNPEAVCVSGIPLLVFFSKIFQPATNVLVAIARNVMRLLNIHEKTESPFLSKEELQVLMGSETEPDAGLGLSKHERKMFGNILRFAERRIQDAMIPRTDIFAIDYNSGLDETITKALTSKYSRIPVYKGTIDNIIGVIYAKDLIMTWQNRKLFVLDDIIRQAYFAPENVAIDNLIREFKSGKHHMAIVVDEYGVTQGLITIEDIVEEIVGEIYDEYDISEKPAITATPGYPGNAWVIKANRNVREINEELKLGIPPSKSYTTIGGWLLILFKKIPSTGEKIKWNEFTIEIMDADKKKVKLIRITK